MEMGMKIYFTVLMVFVLVGFIGWMGFNIDKKRPELWFKISIGSFGVECLMLFAIVLYNVWTL